MLPISFSCIVIYSSWTSYSAMDRCRYPGRKEWFVTFTTLYFRYFGLYFSMYSPAFLLSLLVCIFSSVLVLVKLQVEVLYDGMLLGPVGY